VNIEVRVRGVRVVCGKIDFRVALRNAIEVFSHIWYNIEKQYKPLDKPFAEWSVKP
jgi:hypothetical protein